MTRKEIDWRRFGEVATGVLGWTPAVFWAATPAEFWMAWDGWRARFHPASGRAGSAPLARAELTDLERKFPDRQC